MSWPFDSSPERVTAHRLAESLCEQHGLTREQIALPSTLVATFQPTAFERLVELTQAAELPFGGGSASFHVGRLPASDASVAVRRLPWGAPAAVFVLELAIARGVRDVLVCGSAGSLQPELSIGSTAVVVGAEREDGTSHHYLPAGEECLADPDLTARLDAAARQLGLTPIAGRAWTTDAPFRETEGAVRRHQAAGVAVVEMEAAAIFALAKFRGARAGLIVAISDEVFRPWYAGFHMEVYRNALCQAADAVVLAADELAASKRL